MRVDELATDRRDDASLGYHDGLPCHRRGFVRRRPCLHYFLEVRRQVHKGPRRHDLGFVRVDFELDVGHATRGETRLRRLLLRGELASFVADGV